MRYRVPRRAPSPSGEALFRRIAALVALGLVLGLILVGAAPAPLPEAARPCAPCHGRAGSDRVGEWLASPYSEAQGGRGCADCHGRDCSGRGGSGERPARRQPIDLPSLRLALQLSLSASREGDLVSIEVAVSNVGAGHRLPAGRAGESLILEVEARRPGRTRPLWRAGPRDLRLHPFATLVHRYRFTPLQPGPVEVSARLVLVPLEAPPQPIVEAGTFSTVTGEES
jgi:hypothetical protein